MAGRVRAGRGALLSTAARSHQGCRRLQNGHSGRLHRRLPRPKLACTPRVCHGPGSKHDALARGATQQWPTRRRVGDHDVAERPRGRGWDDFAQHSQGLGFERLGQGNGGGAVGVGIASSHAAFHISASVDAAALHRTFVGLRQRVVCVQGSSEQLIFVARPSVAVGTRQRLAEF